MGIGTGNNIASLAALNNLQRSTSTLSKTYERLSSGMRITDAADDAGGLALASKLDVNARIFATGVRNVSDGISLTSIAQDALQQLKSIISRQQELATQAANIFTSSSQREALDEEAQALVEEYSRITSSTEFNKMGLLDGSVPSLTIQAASSPITIEFTDVSQFLGDAISVNDGTFATMRTFTATTNSNPYGEGTVGDFNGDGRQDVLMVDQTNDSLRVMLGNGDGTFAASKSYSFPGAGAGTDTDVAWAEDFNNDGRDDVVLVNRAANKVWTFIANTDGSFAAPRSWGAADSRDIYASDVNNDGYADILSPFTGGVGVLLGNGNGTFAAMKTYLTGGGFSGFVRTADLNGDDIVDLVVPTNSNDKIAILIGNGNGSFQAASYLDATTNPTSVQLADFNNDGKVDIVAADWFSDQVSVLLGNGNGTFQAEVHYATGDEAYYIATGDLNGDGNIDFAVANRAGNSVNIFTGTGDGSFSASLSLATGANPNAVFITDFNGDSVADLFIAQNGTGRAGILLGNGVSQGQSSSINLLTSAQAETSLTVLSTAAAQLDTASGRMAASESRLSFAVNYLQVQRENYSAAAAQILDVDTASEAAKMIKEKIIQKAASAALAQANLQPKRVLELLNA